MSETEAIDPYKIVVSIRWDISTKLAFSLSSSPRPIFIVAFHVDPPQRPEPADRIGFTTPGGQTSMASYLSRILLNQHNSTIHITGGSEIVDMRFDRFPIKYNFSPATI
jgi:hypothetical protein